MNFQKIFWLLVVLPHLLVGQDFDNYIPIESKGPIPSDFLTRSSDKFNAAKEDLNSDQHIRQTKRAKEDFLLESSFLINQVLNSGRILFNDPVSSYLSSVLDSILQDDQALRNQIRIYAVQSSVVNSFTTDDGIILVNLGLIAQLEDEAQLAFILCHELAHFTEHHVINAYVQNEELKQNIKQYKRGSFDEGILSRNKYSKDLEKEADKLGIQRFLKTNYSTGSILNVFEVLRYAHLPFDDVVFDKTFFNEEAYEIDDSYFLQRVRPAEAMDGDGADEETHPGPTTRQQMVGRFIQSADRVSATTQGFSTENSFESIRTICRFELTSLYLNSNRPVLSIYNAYLLKKEFPENPFLEKSIAKALYTLSKFKTGGNYGYVHPGYSHIQGESQQLYHLFYQLRPEELCILATRYLWKRRQERPEDADLNAMSEDLLQDLIYRYYSPGMFSQSDPPTDWVDIDTSAVLTKYDRLKLKSTKNPRLRMVKYALVDLFNDSEFAAQFDKLEQEKWGPEAKSPTIGELKAKNRADIRSWKNHGFALDLDTIAVVSPAYTKLDLRKKQQHKFLKSESAKSKFIAQIKKSTALLSMNPKILDASLLDSNDVNTFNDITFLNRWIDARFLQLEVGMVNMDQSRIDSIINKYGTEHFAWTGVINYRENKPLMYFYLLYALIPPAIPFAVYYLVRPNFDTYYYCIVFNLRTGEPELVNYNNYRKRDARDMINSSVYDSFWQMKRKPKKKG